MVNNSIYGTTGPGSSLRQQSLLHHVRCINSYGGHTAKGKPAMELHPATSNQECQHAILIAP